MAKIILAVLYIIDIIAIVFVMPPSIPSFFSSSILSPEAIVAEVAVMLARRYKSRALRPNLAESNP